MQSAERVETVVIGAGQAGLAAGYHLRRVGAPFVILESNGRVGDSWRTRWDSLRLFTPARYDSIDGMPFPAAPTYFPTKDEMGDYLERYAAHFALPVRTGVSVTRLSRRGATFVVETSHGTIEAEQVVVAMANYQRGRVPAFAAELDRSIVQVHSVDYRSPAQLRDGAVLVAGAGNSGAEIAMELARQGRKVIVAGRATGHVPFRVESFLGQHLLAPLVLRFVFHRVLTLNTPPGRKAHARAGSHGGPLIRVKPKDLAAAGVERAPRVAGVRGGRPLLDDGRVLDVANVVWCTGFDPGFSWIDLPVFGDDGRPLERRGVVEGEPGLYFTGLHYQFAMSSTMIHGASRDARYVAEAVAARASSPGTTERDGSVRPIESRPADRAPRVASR